MAGAAGHLVQRIAVDVPGAPDSTSIIGCDAANGTYVQLDSDERSACRPSTTSLPSTAANGGAARIAARHWVRVRDDGRIAQLSE